MLQTAHSVQVCQCLPTLTMCCKLTGSKAVKGFLPRDPGCNLMNASCLSTLNWLGVLFSSQDHAFMWKTVANPDLVFCWLWQFATIEWLRQLKESQYINVWKCNKVQWQCLLYYLLCKWSIQRNIALKSLEWFAWRLGMQVIRVQRVRKTFP